MRNWVDQRIKVESWQIRVLSFDEHNIGSVVPKTEEESAQVSLPLQPSLFPNMYSSSHQVRWTWCGRLLYR